MDDRIEVYGEAGVTYANLHMGNAAANVHENGLGLCGREGPDDNGLELSGV